MELIELLKEYGLVGLVLGITYYLLKIAEPWIKAKIPKKETDNGGREAVGRDRRESSQKIYDKLAEVHQVVRDTKTEVDVANRRIGRVEKSLDGNGQPGLIPTVARIDQRLGDHVKDRGLHTSER